MPLEGASLPPTVAILPVRSVGSVPRVDRFADAIGDDLAIALSRFRGLRVVAVPSSGGDAGAASLGAGRVTITVRLIDTATTTCFWAERCEFAHREDGVAIRSTVRRIAATVAERIATHGHDRAARRLAERMTAHDHVLRGQGIVAGSPESNLRARRHFEMAISLGPRSSRAVAGLAHAHVIDAIFDYSASFEGSLDLVLDRAANAGLLDPADCKADWVLGHVLDKRGEGEQALRHFVRALALNPADADAHVMKGICLWGMGEHPQSVACFEAALKLNTHSPGWYLWNLACGICALARHAEALPFLRTFTDRRPAFLRPRKDRAATCAQLGRTGRIVEEFVAQDPQAILQQENAMFERCRTNATGTTCWTGSGKRSAGVAPAGADRGGRNPRGRRHVFQGHPIEWRITMAERKRSTDGRRETEEYLDDAPTPGHQGRNQGTLERKVGTRDEKKRAENDRAGATRVRKSDERGAGGAA